MRTNARQQTNDDNNDNKDDDEDDVCFLNAIIERSIFKRF